MGNELKLILDNFQSISHGELIFHQGINIIIGQSNSGKSATFRALKACLSNPSGSQRFIKKGTSSAMVTLEYNGNQIIWKRTAKENSYIINNEEYHKTGSSSAFKILDDTGFVTDDEGTIMNIEEELQLPFPFDMTRSDLFKLYEDVFCVSDSAIILKAAKGTEDETKDEVALIENEISKNENKLKELIEFKNEVDINKLTNMKLFLEKRNNMIVKLKDGLPLIKKAYRVNDFKVEEQTFTDNYSLYKEKVQLKRDLSKLKKLHALSKTIDCTYAGDELLKENIDKLKELSDLRVTTTTLVALNEVNVQEQEFEDKLQKYKELREYALFLDSLKAKIKAKKNEAELTKIIIQELEETLKGFKVCPLCHQPLNQGEV